MLINLKAAWILFLAGFAAGAAEGLFFHRDDWRGGYDSWGRRMVRLGHISFFGLGLMNLAYALSIRYLGIDTPGPWPSRLFLVGAAAMPVVCYLSAWRKALRHLFIIPAGCVSVAAALFLFMEVLT